MISKFDVRAPLKYNPSYFSLPQELSLKDDAEGVCISTRAKVFELQISLPFP
uniref:Uncharacterized protein n=1 Tax=Rhizophora mucronata TaxID=61149 RepID=A0A2P2IPY3_RHIMU